MAVAFALAAATVAAIALGAGWLITTTGGLRAALSLARLAIPTLEATGIDGSLRDGIRIGRVSLTEPDVTVEIEDLAAQIELRPLLDKVLDLRSVSARRVIVLWATSDTEPTPPSDLRLPFTLLLRSGAIDELRFGARGADPAVLTRIAAAGRMDAEAILVESGSFNLGPTRVALSGRVGSTAPFALNARGELRSALDQHNVVGTLAATGTLLKIEATLDAVSQDSRARIDATLAPFKRLSVVRLQVDLDNFDPALWFDDVPTMRLTATADLLPIAASAGAPSDGRLRVSGPFSIENAIAGPLDRQRLPIRSARGVLTWGDDALALTLDQVLGVRGSASGRMTWSTAAGVDARLRVSGIDAATIDTRLKPTDIGGEFNVTAVESQQQFTGNLRNGRGLPLVAAFDLGLRDRLLTIRTARLQLGEGRADVQGRVELSGGYATRLSGTVSALDLAQLVRGADTRINGSFEVDARLAEPRSGRASMQLADSRLYGRTLSGKAVATLAERRIDVELDVNSGSSRLTAQGGIGAGRELLFDLSVPDLAQLFPRTGGKLTVRGTIAGELSDPRVRATLAGSELKFANGHTLALADVTLAVGTAAKEPLALVARISGYRTSANSEIVVESAALIARGVTDDHTIDLSGATLAKEPLRALAHGGWKDSAWRGALIVAETGAPFNLLVRSPIPVVVGLSQLAIGPGDFELAGARYVAVDLKREDGRWRTAGTVEGLQPQALDPGARAPRRVVRSNAGDRVPLTLAGRWDLEYTDSVTGIAIIQRTGGDLYSGVDGLNPIGVSDVGAALNIVANRMTGNVYLRGRALGKVDAAVDAYLDPLLKEGRPLAQARPFRIVIDATLPDLSWIGPLIGDSVQFAGRGEIRASIGGTPAEPTSQGTIRGDDLRLAWVDQAVRLDDGRLEAELEDGVLVLTDLSFTGTPRADPIDRRALANTSATRPHEVRATGRIALSTLTGSIGVRAQQLPVLQSRERWMTVSGEGGITLTPQRAEVYGKLTADGAYINFASLRGTRSLPNDVVVVRTAKPARVETTAPLEVHFDVQGGLGDRFYVEGTGLETRIVGQVQLSGRASQLRATGSVRAVDGVFNGYGQRLQIDRGIVTFQGPIDDPALNVLALRTGLPVEVGVAIGGTVQQPIVRLHSNPAMSDAERLNWLVLGRPPSASDGQDRALLSAAASALFSGQGDGASANLMRSLGIDEITVRPGSDGTSLLPRETVAGRLRSTGQSAAAATDFVAIGKRINDDLYLSFEQALTGTEYFIALSYRLTKNLSLIARAGSTNALDLVYSFAFD